MKFVIGEKRDDIIINYNCHLYANFMLCSMHNYVKKSLCCTYEFSLMLVISYDESIAHRRQND